MPKKRKLNSKNPKYWSKEKSQVPAIKKRIFIKKVHGCTIEGLWFENKK